MEELRLFMRKAAGPLDAKAISDDLRPLFLESLKGSGVQIVADASLPHDQLIKMAVGHRRPFQKEDRGFKDIVILHSILSHAKSAGISNVLLLAADEVFSHQDIIRRAADEGIHFVSVRSIEEAIETLNRALSQVKRQQLETRAARLRSFLLTQQDKIISRIRGVVQIEPYYFGLSKIVEIKTLELADVESALPGFLPTGTTEGRLKVYFVAKLRVVAVGEPPFELPGPPTVRLEEGMVVEDISSTLGPFSGLFAREQIEKVITPSVGVEASVNHSEITGAYSDLKVEALVQPTVISEMLMGGEEKK